MLTELFNRMKPGITQDKEDEEQAVAGIRDNDIRKDGMCVLTAVTEYTHDAEILLQLPAGTKVNDGSGIIIVDVTVTGTPRRDMFQFRLKLFHVGVKRDFDEVFIRISLHNSKFFLS